MMRTIRSVEGMAAVARRWRREGRRIAFVPTMGALHKGHASLMRAARRWGDKVVVSIFVNPTQFGPAEDFRKYPRTLGQDSRMLKQERVDALFYPDASAMYPDGFVTSVSAGKMAEGLCGKFRPGHFDGVATVVAKLFAVVRPDMAFFGQKDYQQCKIVQRMSEDLNLGVRIRMMPIVREKGGLAMSSRNRYLSARQRQRALGIFFALNQARRAVRSGVKESRSLIRLAAKTLHNHEIKKIDYVAIADGKTLEPLRKVRPPAVMAVAVRLGSTRLIDNMFLAR